MLWAASRTRNLLSDSWQRPTALPPRDVSEFCRRYIHGALVQHRPARPPSLDEPQSFVSRLATAAPAGVPASVESSPSDRPTGQRAIDDELQYVCTYACWLVLHVHRGFESRGRMVIRSLREEAPRKHQTVTLVVSRPIKKRSRCRWPA